MKNTISILFFACVITASCCQNNELSQIKILPLHPYSASPSDYDKNTNLKHEYIAKYYFVHGAYKATDELSSTVDTFIISSLKKDDRDFNKYGGYYFYLYKETDELNINFRQQADGIFTNTLDGHEDDLLFRYRWEDQQFIICDYYQNGKIIKTVYGKRGALFKQSIPSSVIQEIESKKIIIQDVPLKDSAKNK